MAFLLALAIAVVLVASVALGAGFAGPAVVSGASAFGAAVYVGLSR